ncbi:MAG: 16S rRNA (guanine(966)-N(2))-methyltransferase RsmD [Desulfovibrionales bacterium]
MRIIAGEFRGRNIHTVSGPGYRPATSKVRQAIFSMLESRGVQWSGTRVLDLFAGSGSLGLEALSRGAEEVWFVEKSRRAVESLRRTLSDLKVRQNRFRVAAQDLFTLLRHPAHDPFHVVFIDPPYGKDLLLPALKLALAGSWIGSETLVLAETEADLVLDPQAVPKLELLVNRTYGQTRIYLWRPGNQLSIREPSTP